MFPASEPAEPAGIGFLPGHSGQLVILRANKEVCFYGIKNFCRLGFPLRRILELGMKHSNSLYFARQPFATLKFDIHNSAALRKLASEQKEKMNKKVLDVHLSKNASGIFCQAPPGEMCARSRFIFSSVPGSSKVNKSFVL